MKFIIWLGLLAASIGVAVAITFALVSVASTIGDVIDEGVGGWSYD